MFCDKCGAEIVDENSKFCSSCGASISTSAKEKKPKNNVNIKKAKKIPIKTVIIIVVVIAIILCGSLIYLEQTSRTSEIHSEIGGHYIGKEGSDFTVKAYVSHNNIFGPVRIDNEDINVTVRNDAGEVVSQMTIKEDEWHNFDNLPLGHYTVELSYAGDYPSTNSTRDFVVISPEEFAQKSAEADQKRIDNVREFNKMYHAVFGYGYGGL